MTGVFITRGMTVGVPEGGLRIRIGPDGRPAGQVEIHVHFDVCPVWLELAWAHLASANQCKAARIAAWEAEDNDERALTLEREFIAAMQAIMAAAIATEAFYANIRDKAGIAAHLAETWRLKRTARFKQIAEVLRQAFNLRPPAVKALRHNLRQLFQLRDLAIHPHGNILAPVVHPEIQTGVEWRFATFRAENANALVTETIRMIRMLVERATPRNELLRQYTSGLSDKLQSLALPSLDSPGT